MHYLISSMIVMGDRRLLIWISHYLVLGHVEIVRLASHWHRWLRQVRGRNSGITWDHLRLGWVLLWEMIPHQMLPPSWAPDDSVHWVWEFGLGWTYRWSLVCLMIDISTTGSFCWRIKSWRSQSEEIQPLSHCFGAFLLPPAPKLQR